MKLQYRILLPIILLIVGLQAVQGALSYRIANEELSHTFEDYMETVALSGLSSYRELLRVTERSMQRVGETVAVQEFILGDMQNGERQQTMSQDLAIRVQSFPNLDRISIFDLQGNVVAASNPAVIGTSFADRDYIQVPRGTGRPFASAPIFSRVINRAVVLVTVPIVQQGKVTALIAGTIDLGVFSDNVLKEFKIGEGGHLKMLTAKGEVALSAMQPETIFNDNIPEARAFQAIAASQTPFHTFANAQGQPMLAYTAKYEQGGVVMMTVVPRYELRRGDDDGGSPVRVAAWA